MTLEDVLTMRAGLEWSDDDTTLRRFYSASEAAKFVLDSPMAADPGTEFNYCSGCSHLLTILVSKLTGMNTADFAQQELLDPLGIKGAYWTRDRSGIPLGGWGLSLTAREMAKLGYLYLRGGTWDGRAILTRDWVQSATAKHTTTDTANGYGYQWWTHAEFPAYMALGRFGQIIYVNPEKDLVVAIRANVPNHDPIFHLIETYLEPAVR
jgi:CubicO group peptidase (beta-lactamase class C family)